MGGSGAELEWLEEEMTGTVNQVDWAEQIKARVSAEFDRVANALESAASKQAEPDRMDTQAMIGILEEKRAEVARLVNKPGFRP